jgi:GTPase SAR1 family protein
VGKTATVRSLLGLPFDPKLASTVGADATKTCVVDRKERVVNWEEKIGMEGREYDQMVAQFVAQKLETVTTEDILNENDESADDKFAKYLLEQSELETIGGSKPALKKIKKKKSVKGGNDGDDDDENTGSDDDSTESSDSLVVPLPEAGGEDKATLFDEQLVLESLKNGDAVTFSLWDFGGQQVFYALHHVFLTRYVCECCGQIL